MKSLNGTQTRINLLTAFAGESQARNRYDCFAGRAKKDGYELVRAIFEETALQEKEHAKRLFKFLDGGDAEIAAAFPAGVISDSYTNLVSSAAGENHEHTEMYPAFAQVAEKEGFPEIASVMRAIAVAEAFHERRFLKLAKEIKEGHVFVRETATKWRCRNCGCIVDAAEAPEFCPACAHPRAYFEELNFAF